MFTLSWTAPGSMPNLSAMGTIRSRRLQVHELRTTHNQFGKQLLANSSPLATLELRPLYLPPAVVPRQPPNQLKLTELPDHQQPVFAPAVTAIIAAPILPHVAPTPPEPADVPSPPASVTSVQPVPP
ncbi:hypothetical protein LWI28_000907 [Acer negundo]|uniref:Uncharacterized protein n=1 Tax=Acer negundo TaxID=4023 RepID=A0AAD5IWV3_ACENE|nr:hypothetical protein LWI28_000907 [Acer negundo]